MIEIYSKRKKDEIGLLTHEVLELHKLDCGGANLLCAEHFHVALETGKEMLASSLAAAHPKILF